MPEDFNSPKRPSEDDSSMPPAKKSGDELANGSPTNEEMQEISRKARQLTANFARMPVAQWDDLGRTNTNWKECKEARRAFFAELAQLNAAINEHMGKKWQFGKVEAFTLLDIFAYLDRRCLDAVQCSSFRFHLVISKKIATQCLRPIQYAAMYYREKRGLYVISANYWELETGSADQQNAVSILMSRCRAAITPYLDLGKVPLTPAAMQEFLTCAPFVFTNRLRFQARNGSNDEAKAVLNHCLTAGITELVMKDFTVFNRRRSPELGHDTGISEDDILRFCFEPSGDYSDQDRVLELESSTVTPHFVERLLDYAARKEYDHVIKLIVLTHEQQTAYEDRNKLWRASVKGRVIMFAYKCKKSLYYF